MCSRSHKDPLDRLVWFHAHLKHYILEERNRADQTIHDIESKLNEYKDQLDADEVKTLQDDAARVSTHDDAIVLNFTSSNLLVITPFLVERRNATWRR